MKKLTIIFASLFIANAAFAGDQHRPLPPNKENGFSFLCSVGEKSRNGNGD